MMTEMIIPTPTTAPIVAPIMTFMFGPVLTALKFTSVAVSEVLDEGTAGGDTEGKGNVGTGIDGNEGVGNS